MRLSKNKVYSVEKIEHNGEGANYGPGYNGTEVRQIIGRAKWDETFEMFFTANGETAYVVKEC